MSSALIGHTGFVGSTLLRQRSFDAMFNSRNIGELAGRRFELAVCAGAPAQKWLANRDPDGDRARLAPLLEALETLECRQLVLISTVDVFSHPVGVDESSAVDESGLHAYGRHRLELERRVMQRFPNALIIRLPGLVGPGLRKNALHDLRHDHDLHALDSRGVFQFYPMVQLWYDIRAALGAGLRLLHLTAEPVSVAEAGLQGFGREFRSELPGKPGFYDLRTRHSSLAGGNGPYHYSKRDSLLAIRAYAQSEPRKEA